MNSALARAASSQSLRPSAADASASVASISPFHSVRTLSSRPGRRRVSRASNSKRLARSTLTGAAALLAHSGEEPSELRRQVTSPGGTTQAALDVLLGEAGLQRLMREAVVAAVRRSKELGA